MKTSSPLGLLLLLPLLVLWMGYGYADSSTNNDAVANERPPLTGDDLAKHWGLNCQQTAFKTESWSQQQLIQARPDMSSVEWRSLELCAVIYNARDTGRYQPCPAYGKALLALKYMASGEIKPDPLVITAYLVSCDKNK
jgi:hypothetical protein